MGKLLDDTDYKILLGSGATKSFISKQCYLRNKTLHGVKFSSRANIGLEIKQVLTSCSLFL